MQYKYWSTGGGGGGGVYLHVLPLLHMEEVFALHGLLKQSSVLQHQGLDLVQEVAVLLFQVPLQLTQQLAHKNIN